MQKESEVEISYRIGGGLSDEVLNGLFAECWPDHSPQSYSAVLGRSLLYVTAHANEKLVGFVNLAWDGGEHAFLLDTTVAPKLRRQGVGTKLVRGALAAAKDAGVKWVHVDFEPHLKGFYAGCGFRPTEAGLIRLSP
jgi:GNAT superfamily N-acetyltransferase